MLRWLHRGILVVSIVPESSTSFFGWTGCLLTCRPHGCCTTGRVRRCFAACSKQHSPRITPRSNSAFLHLLVGMRVGRCHDGLRRTRAFATEVHSVCSTFLLAHLVGLQSGVIPHLLLRRRPRLSRLGRPGIGGGPGRRGQSRRERARRGPRPPSFVPPMPKAPPAAPEPAADPPAATARASTRPAGQPREPRRRICAPSRRSPTFRATECHDTSILRAVRSNDALAPHEGPARSVLAASVGGNGRRAPTPRSSLPSSAACGAEERRAGCAYKAPTLHSSSVECPKGCLDFRRAVL